MKVTGTSRVESRTEHQANFMVAHNGHNPETKHANVQIDSSLTYLNRHVKLLSRESVLQEHYGDMLIKRRKSIERRYKEGRISKAERDKELKEKASLHGYLSSGKKEKHYLSELILTLGNLETEFKMLDKLGYDYKRVRVRDKWGNYHSKPVLTNPKQRDEFLDILWETYMKEIEYINKSDAGIKITECWLHADEGGMPHLHAECVNCGFSTTGRVSFDSNEALRRFCESKKSGVNYQTSHSKLSNGKKLARVNGKDVLKDFRDIVDPVMINAFNQALKERGLDNKLHASLVRLGTKGNMSMDEYQSRKHAQQQLAVTCKSLGINPHRKDGKLLAPTTMARKIAKVAKQERENHDAINHEKNEVKQQEDSIMDEIALREPNHKVNKERLHNEEPAPISSSEGREQHREQGLGYLTRTLLLVIRRTTRALLESLQDELSDDKVIRNGRDADNRAWRSAGSNVRFAGRASVKSRQYKQSEWFEAAANGLMNAVYGASAERLRNLQQQRTRGNNHDNDLER